MRIVQQRRHRSGYKKDLDESLPTERKESEHPFKLRIHRNVLPMLERIGVPEPMPFLPDPFQLEALEALQHSDVLVTAPTGAGKTYVAIKAIEMVFSGGGKSWYASPLKALSNAKYEEFAQIFGTANVGILTGDRKENTHAPIIVGTTEILRNQLYDTMHRGENLAVDLVVLDEAHYLGDHDRGVVWEEVLIYLPARVKLLLLSATIDNSQEICEWLRWIRSTSCQWIAAEQRPVPLFPLYLFPSGELAPLSTRRGLYAKIHTIEPRSFSRRDFPHIRQIMDVLREANLLPAIFFLKSRSDCEKAIALCGPSFGKNRRKDSQTFRKRLKGLLHQYPFLNHHQHLSILKDARVAAHHGGQLPHWKILMEKLMQEGHLDAIFSTSTVAAGVNFPARTVVITQSDRFNGKGFVELTATDLLQMTGRAGRRGMDEIGFVLLIPGLHQDPLLIHDLLKSSPDPIASQIRINFSMALNLLLSHSQEEVRTLFASSFAIYQNLNREAERNGEFQALQSEIEQWLPEMACGSMDALSDIRPQHVKLRDQLRNARKLWKRQAVLDSLFSFLAPGRIFYSKRGTPYIAVSDPDMERRTVEAVRLAFPVRFRRGCIRSFRVGFHRIREMGPILQALPESADREGWKNLAFKTIQEKPRCEDTQCKPRKGEGTTLEAVNNELTAIITRMDSLPCDRCSLFGPCQKSTSHPFAFLIPRYFEQKAQMQSIQARLWQDFQKHYKFLQQEGYVSTDGHLTEDGLWASKLRLDQPMLISEGIRRGVFPSENPQLLAALIAPFVMDRDRPGDHQLANMVWKYQDMAGPFFKMLESLQPLKAHLEDVGFSVPPLPFWTVVTVYHWAHGMDWDNVREISGMDEGDLAMVILRTADHLRQIESLSESHPALALSARKAIELILREPVLV